MLSSVVAVLSFTIGHEIWPQEGCDNSTFPFDASGTQFVGLKLAKDAQSLEDCQSKCCGDEQCWVYQFKPKPADAAAQQVQAYGCWFGHGRRGRQESGWVGRSKKNAPSPPAPSPPPPPPPPGPPGQYTVDDTLGLGLRWEGVGAISGGGATSKLLMDYDPAVVSDILDFMFLPNFGLDLDILKVEMGGDTDSTEGAEPSHMHSKGDADYNRGYEWWLMKEAKARKPDIKLYGLPWGWAGWLDPSAGPSKEAKDPFYNPSVTANYTLSWLEAAKTEHNLTIDYMGQWNERDAPKAYALALRAAVTGSKILDGKTTVLNRLPHYPGTGTENSDCSKMEWNSTDGENWVDEEGSIFDGRSARCLARCVNRNYVTKCKTATFQWHLISSFYDYLPWSRCGVAIANQPWSGAYEITSPTWALAHTTQFSDPGWRYTLHDNGVTMLSAGGSVVTRLSPDASDFSIVIEKMSDKNSACARGSNPHVPVAEELLTFTLKGSFLKAVKAGGKSLTVWKSDLTSGNQECASTPGVLFAMADGNRGNGDGGKSDDGPLCNPPDDQVFVKQSAPLMVSDNGTFTLSVKPEEMYTITTLTTGKKGTAEKPSPPATPFPIPFKQNFDAETLSSPPAYWYDQMGAWQVSPDPRNVSGGAHVMRQMSPIWPACWGYSCSGPMSYFGPDNFNTSNGLTLSLDVMLEDDAIFTIGLGDQTLDLDSGGTFTLHGDSGRKVTGSAKFGKGSWHIVELKMGASSTTASLDGAVLGNVTWIAADGKDGGSAGHHVKMSLSAYVFANVDNFAMV